MYRCKPEINVTSSIFLFYSPLYFILVFQDRISLYSSSCPGTCSVDQNDLNSGICLPLPPELWD
ncbi:hypothetical protein I79_019256 [Cricetulus griseus]|uniref:Uncharacterized protein n=1 Tax=Cricetulus griseus TaxID=10029 RepID=G3I6X7_CRIGR|nr:hypothetical protein I79_019256 [Cricetulus griseus]